MSKMMSETVELTALFAETVWDKEPRATIEVTPGWLDIEGPDSVEFLIRLRFGDRYVCSRQVISLRELSHYCDHTSLATAKFKAMMRDLDKEKAEL